MIAFTGRTHKVLVQVMSRHGGDMNSVTQHSTMVTRLACPGDSRSWQLLT